MSCPLASPSPGPADSPVTSLAHPGPWAGARPPQFADLCSTRVGGGIGNYVEARSEAEMVEAVRAADAAHAPLLVLGGGSNLLARDEVFEGTVVRDLRTGIEADTSSACAGALIKAPAGQPWDDLVARAVAEGWMGFEALSGIPGTVGAAPIQNIGAYGQEVSETLAAVRVWDRGEGRTRTFALGELRLGYRDSLFKRTLTDPVAGGGRLWGPTGRYVVLEVSFHTRLSDSSGPVRYTELAGRLGIQVGERASSRQVREAVLELRGGKGMVLDAADRDTWSTGSFFTNPILSAHQAELLPESAPRYPAALRPGAVKTSAAWLIEHAGFPRGFALPGSQASLSTKHVLALTNRGGASAREIRELGEAVVQGVEAAFGVCLTPEPVLL